ncbi:substrate-binding periplasmic protein [Curvivirga sp.]|uniref:substrate-binding periplasmic protein n=1 Tax=Curvivirga sp. TaxID=2856848 RepID=UPI003B5BA8CC
MGACIFLYMGFVVSALAESQKIKLATGTDYAPYTDPDLPGGGVVSQIVRRVFEEMDYEVEIGFYPWKRTYQRTLELQNDATFPFAKNAEREADFLFSRPINQINVRFYEYRETAKNIQTVEDIIGMTYCQPLGYLTEPELTDLIAAGQLSRFEATDMPACFKVLGLGRVNFVLANDFVAWESAQAAFGMDGFDRIKPAEEPIRRAYEYLMISRQHPKGRMLIDQFNNAYGSLLDNGTLQQIWTDAIGKNAKPAS